MGAWIEIPVGTATLPENVTVAPLVGAWIEMLDTRMAAGRELMSLPLWERGLKLLKGLR